VQYYTGENTEYSYNEKKDRYQCPADWQDAVVREELERYNTGNKPDNHQYASTQPEEEEGFSLRNHGHYPGEHS
jgi:hypothetical protein